MTFLPVVERELRVSARKRSTFWLRVVAGLIALFIGAGFLVLAALVGQGTAGFGGALFKTLTWLALAAAVSAGFFFTADALSEEKREGTLGFLFLTDLRGYDVTGGKLLATSLRGSYALLAFFPILATTLLMGGVTGAEFWKTTLALVNALFISLGVGLLVSSISWDSQKAMGGTFLLLIGVCAGGPVLDACVALLPRHTFIPRLTLLSPVYAFISAGAWGHSFFWQSLLLSHATGWLALASGSLLIRRTWQDRILKRSPGSTGTVGAGSRRGRKLLDKEPVLWLALRERWPAMVMLFLTLCATAGFALDVTFSKAFGTISTKVIWLLMAVLYLWTASLASRLFVETRRGGFLELMLVTPLSVKDASQAQWGAWQKLFGLPIVLAVVLNFAVTWHSHDMLLANLGPRSPAVLPLVLITLSAGLGASCNLLNLAALVWFGMWMGLRSKNASLATLKTIAFVEIIPWFAINFISGLSVVGLTVTQAFRNGAATGSMPAWISLAIPLLMTGVASVLSIGKDIFFIRWSRGRLYACTREQAVLNLAPIRQTPSAIAAPPPVQPLPA